MSVPVENKSLCEKLFGIARDLFQLSISLLLYFISDCCHSVSVIRYSIPNWRTVPEMPVTLLVQLCSRWAIKQEIVSFLMLQFFFRCFRGLVMCYKDLIVLKQKILDKTAKEKHLGYINWHTQAER